MSRARILRALNGLAQEMDTRGARGKVFIVGGAAMALAYSARRSTRDIYEAARSVAERQGLPDDWLNDAVKGFAPGKDPDSRMIFSTPSLEVATASPEYLLAMKLLASRVDQDVDDIRVLYRRCGLKTADDGLDLLERFYPGRALGPRIRLLLEELYGPSTRGPKKRS